MTSLDWTTVCVCAVVYAALLTDIVNLCMVLPINPSIIFSSVCLLNVINGQVTHVIFSLTNNPKTKELQFTVT